MGDAVNLMYSMLLWDPNKRYSAAKCLQHAYFEANSVPDGINQHSARQLPQLPSARSVDRSAEKLRAPSNNGDVFAHNNTPKREVAHVNQPTPSRKFLGGNNGKENETTTKINLPLLAQERKDSGQQGARYLRMARYQPGMQQMPALPVVKSNLSTVVPPPQHTALSKKDHLPDLEKPGGYFGAHAARMF